MLKYKEIFLGTRCNNNCLYCAYRQNEKSEPDLNTIISSLNKSLQLPPISKGGQGRVKEENVAFYGGDPTLRSDLFEIIHEAKTNGYRRIKLITNGRAFSDIQYLYHIINSGCYLFEIKLWGSNPSLHDHITQTAGSFWETIQGLENLAGLPDEKFVCVRIPICKENYTDLENCVSTALNFGVNRIILSLQDYKMAFNQVLPHIKNAINISIFNRIWIQTEGMPFCIMQGLEQHIGEILNGLNTMYEKTFKHHEYCIQCIYKELCPGTEVRYLGQFGHKEFSPVVINKYFQNIKALYE